MWLEILLVTITTYLVWQIFKKPAEYPPGPWGLPLIGYIPFGQNEEEFIYKLKEQHGNIISWRLGTRIIVVIFEYDKVREAFQSQNFINRPDVELLGLLPKNEEGKRLGLVATNGTHWNNIRRFSLRHLRDLGMGKSRLVTGIQHEANELVEDFKKHAGRAGPFPYAITTAVLNVVWQMVASKRYDLDDKEIIDFDRMFHAVFSNFLYLSIENFIPWIKAVLPKFLVNLITKQTTMDMFQDKLKKFLMKIIDEHKKTLDPDNPRDYIDDYLTEMEKDSDFSETMSTEDLMNCIADLFGAGTETTTNTLKWSMLYLANFQEVQARLQKEIDEVLPKGSSVTLQDKPRLPYTEAFIHEVLRYSSLVSTGVWHTPTDDIKFGGYTIPKDAFVISFAHSVHFNSKYFDSPQKFSPERYIDQEGKFVNPRQGFMPFGVGRRQCLGESLARMELLIFLTTLVQNFQFEPPPGKKVDLKPMRMPFFHFVNSDQDILIKIR